ncbi:MAG TPA: plastocyanin/azurin family copper-binding protein [bacterium]
MNRFIPILLVLIMVLAFGVTGAPAAATYNTTWTAYVGGLSKDHAVNANAFFPRTLEISVGDTVTWKFLYFHTVTFLSGAPFPPFEIPQGNKMYFNPKAFFPVGGKTYDGTGYRNSGVPPLDPKAPPFSYSLTFTKTGTYEYVCTVHGPLMSARIVVKDKAMGSPAAALTQAKQEQAAAVSAGLAAWARFKPDKMGNTVVVPMMGNYPQGRYTFLRYTPRPLTISRGTTVTWKMADPTEIHTVTFLGGTKQPEDVLVEPQKQGPPKIRFNPKAEFPAGNPKTWTGRGYLNSGVLFTPGPGAPPNAPSAFSLTFTRRGTYQYLCMVHYADGMRGTVIVK